MAFQPGRIPTLGVTPSFITGLATQTASSGVPQAVGQIWQGSGQSFIGQAGQALGGGLAASAINIALNGTLGTSVVGPQGLSLTSGSNLLASVVTPYVTGALAAGINQNIQQSLTTAGPFGPVLSNFATGITNQVFSGISNNVLGATSTVTNYKMFPGGGGEPPSDYGGSAYTLSDVVFSLQPANQGPQAFGDEQAISFPKSATKLPFNQLTSMPLLAGSPTANLLKKDVMVQGLSRATVSTRKFSTAPLL